MRDILHNPPASRSLGVVVILVLAACRHNAGSGRALPSPIAIEFASGPVPAAAGLSRRLSAIGVASFFVPAVVGRASGIDVSFESLGPPSAPYALPVYLEVAGRGDFDAALRRDPRHVAESLVGALAPLLTRAYGRIAGVHVAWRVTDSSEGYASVLKALRRRLPRSYTVSASIEGPLSKAQAMRWKSVGRCVDFIVAEVFGRGEDLDPGGVRFGATLDRAWELDAPVFAGYAPQGWGVLRSKEGSVREVVSDAAVNELSEDRRFEFSFGDLLSDAEEDVYVFSARQPARSPRWTGTVVFGDSLTFREHRVADLTKAFADARAVVGKIVRLASLDDDGRLVGFRTLEDILLGRALEPKLSFSGGIREGEATLVAANTGAETSGLSRLNNWIDLRVEGARFLDVRPGDFDRFLFLDGNGRPARAARARTLRLFENFVAPGESMATGKIRLSRAAAIYASAHLVLPDGRAIITPEARVGSASDQAASPIQHGSGREREPVERKPHR